MIWLLSIIIPIVFAILTWRYWATPFIKEPLKVNDIICGYSNRPNEVYLKSSVESLIVEYFILYGIKPKDARVWAYLNGWNSEGTGFRTQEVSRTELNKYVGVDEVKYEEKMKEFEEARVKLQEEPPKKVNIQLGSYAVSGVMLSTGHYDYGGYNQHSIDHERATEYAQDWSPELYQEVARRKQKERAAKDFSSQNAPEAVKQICPPVTGAKSPDFGQ